MTTTSESSSRRAHSRVSVAASPTASTCVATCTGRSSTTSSGWRATPRPSASSRSIARRSREPRSRLSLGSEASRRPDGDLATTFEDIHPLRMQRPALVRLPRLMPPIETKDCSDMREIDIFDGTAGRLDGILDAPQTLTGGRILRRLPAWTSDQVLDLVAEFMATIPTGARIDLVTDTTSIELDVQLTRVAFADEPPAPAVFDLEIDGDVVTSESTDLSHVFQVEVPSQNIEFREGEPATVTFAQLPAGTKRLKLWLPQNASVELRAVRVDDGATV